MTNNGEDLKYNNKRYITRKKRNNQTHNINSNNKRIKKEKFISTPLYWGHPFSLVSRNQKTRTGRRAAKNRRAQWIKLEPSITVRRKTGKKKEKTATADKYRHKHRV